MAKKRRLAKLTAEEDKAWTTAFVHYKDDGKTDSRADRMAWRDVQEQFPRLKQYDGCKP